MDASRDDGERGAVLDGEPTDARFDANGPVLGSFADNRTTTVSGPFASPTVE